VPVLSYVPVLKVQNGYSVVISGLGKIRAFSQLSEKRITKAVREALRGKYGESSVEVSCTALFHGGSWRGRCEIDGREHEYYVAAA
jgi:hypothetical protein